MKITKISLALLCSLTVGGSTNLYLIPQHNADKVKDKESVALYGSLTTAMVTTDGLALLGDPAALPAVGSALEKELLSFTERCINAGIELGFEPVLTNEVVDWNETVQAFAVWMTPPAEEAAPEAPTAEAAAEQVAEPLTPAQAAEIVAETEVSTEGEAAIAEVVAVAEEITGVELSPAAALGVLTAEKVMKATSAANQINEALHARAQEALTALQDVLQMSGANKEILGRLAAHAQATLPAEVEVPA